MVGDEAGEACGGGSAVEQPSVLWGSWWVRVPGRPPLCPAALEVPRWEDGAWHVAGLRSAWCEGGLWPWRACIASGTGLFLLK